MIDTPEISHTPARLTATIRIKIRREDMMHLFGPALEELIKELSAQGIPPQGSAFAHHFEITEETFDFELGFVTETPVAPSGRMKPGEWPAQKVARTTYHGPYEGLPGAWGEFSTWMESQDLAEASDLWEHYVEGPHTTPDPAAYRTDLYRPLTK